MVKKTKFDLQKAFDISMSSFDLGYNKAIWDYQKFLKKEIEKFENKSHIQWITEDTDDIVTINSKDWIGFKNNLGIKENLLKKGSSKLRRR